MFKVEGIGYNVKYIRNVVGTKVKKLYIYMCMYIYIYISTRDS